MVNREGSVTPLCAGLVLILSVGAFGTWGLLRSWRSHVETQLALDRCVGEQTLALKRTVGLAEASNLRMRVERAAATAAQLTPQTAAAARAVLVAEEIIQAALRVGWEADEGLWMAGALCPQAWGPWNRRFQIPAWTRAPDDNLGPQAYEWVDEKPAFSVALRAGGRAAAATIETEEENADEIEKIGQFSAGGDWKARWTSFR